MSFPSVVSESYDESETDVLHVGLPDLVWDIEFEQIGDNGYYYAWLCVTNIGEAPAVPESNFSLQWGAYPFGAYHLKDAWIWFFDNLPEDLWIFFAELLLVKLHFWPSPNVEGEDRFYEPLNPGETIKRWSLFPINDEADEFFNARLCIIISGMVDPENRIVESNEDNNKFVVRWWFTKKTDPPS
jgi:hypothetical protein